MKLFQEWFFRGYKTRFERDYQVTDWGKFRGQLKTLFSLPNLSFHDLQYLTIEFLLDEDPYLKNKAGYNIGSLLIKIGQNVYGEYRNPKFRAEYAQSIINEDGTRYINKHKQKE